jgi:hypothetical protein
VHMAGSNQDLAMKAIGKLWMMRSVTICASLRVVSGCPEGGPPMIAPNGSTSGLLSHSMIVGFDVLYVSKFRVVSMGLKGHSVIRWA